MRDSKGTNAGSRSQMGSRAGAPTRTSALFGGALLAILLVLSAAAAQTGPTAVIVAVEGEAEVALGGAEPTQATVGTRLSPGDRVLPGSGGRVVLVRRGGDRTAVTDSFTVEAPSSAGSDGGDMFSRTVQVLGQVAAANTDELMDRQGMIRPIPGEPVLVSPRNRLTVMSPRPSFTWRSVDGASGYTIQIRSPGSRPLRFQDVADTTWTYPRSAPLLIPGREYWWTVAPVGSGRATREQRFRVIGPEEYAAVTRDLSALEEVGLDPAGEGAFLAAVLFSDAGLYYDAAGALEFLEESDVSLGPDAYLLMGEVLVELGDAEGAGRAFETADRLRR